MTVRDKWGAFLQLFPNNADLALMPRLALLLAAHRAHRSDERDDDEPR